MCVLEHIKLDTPQVQQLSRLTSGCCFPYNAHSTRKRMLQRPIHLPNEISPHVPTNATHCMCNKLHYYTSTELITPTAGMKYDVCLWAAARPPQECTLKCAWNIHSTCDIKYEWSLDFAHIQVYRKLLFIRNNVHRVIMLCLLYLKLLSVPVNVKMRP